MGEAAGPPGGRFSGPAAALEALEASLGYLAAADVADWPADALAGGLRALGRAESAQLAARSRVMSAFSAQGGFEADGQPTVRTWLRWQTQITNGASHAAVWWMRRLAVHPRVTAALGGGRVTTSFARLICDASDLLPPHLRDEADEILLAAVAGGATQSDLGMLAQDLAGFPRPDCACGDCTCPPGLNGLAGPGALAGPGGPGVPGALAGSEAGPGGSPLPPGTRRRLQNTLLAYAADILSGPAGLAALLRTGLLAGDFPASASLPLDTGTPTPAIPPHLRRAVTLRDRHCAFPGCTQKPAACQAHHLIPRAKGGVTALRNLALLCSFHHLIAVHRWGWVLVLNADGTTTATSPDGRRVFHSHGPPAAAA